MQQEGSGMSNKGKTGVARERKSSGKGMTRVDK
jgi:hypothetical protein